MQKPTYERHFKTPIGVEEIEIVKLLPQERARLQKGEKKQSGRKLEEANSFDLQVLRQKEKKEEKLG